MNKERSAQAVLFVFLSALATLLWNAGNPNSQLSEFGWEYGNIAASLACGRGFSDAMGVGTGPTAWMPPLLPALYALIFAVAGVKTPAAIALAVGLRCLAGGICLWWVQKWCEEMGGPWASRTAVVLTYVSLYLDRNRSLGELHDAWFINLCAVLTVYILTRPRAKSWLACSLLPLASPQLALPLLAGLALQARRGLILCVLASAGLWTARNYAVLGRFYPIKSNFAFELVEGNVREESGLFTASFAALQHPVNDNFEGKSYRSLGEAAYLDAASAQRSDITWSGWMSRTARRFGNATWHLQDDQDVGVAHVPPRDIPRLQKASLLYESPHQPLWLSLTSSTQEEALRHIAVSDWVEAVRDRRRAVEEFRLGHEQVERQIWSYWFTLLPALALATLAFSGKTAPRAGRIAATVYGAYLLPYILVQHYARFQVSLSALQVLVEVSAAVVLSRFKFVRGSQAGSCNQPWQ